MRTSLKKIKQKVKNMTSIFEELDTLIMKKVTPKPFSFKILFWFLSINLIMMTNKILFVCLDWLKLWVYVYMFLIELIFFLKAWSLLLNILIISMIFILQYLCWLFWYNWIYMFLLNDYAWFWMWHENYLIKVLS